MKDNSSSNRLVSVRHAGVSRRRLLGASALGVAGALFAPPPLVSSALADTDDRARKRRQLLKGGIVLTLEGKSEPFRGDVLIQGEKIRDIGRHLQVDDADVIDCADMIVMPGFIDTHRHMWQGLLRNIGPDDLLNDYLVKILYGLALKMTPEDVYLGDTVAALSAMSAGITTILDWSHIANSRAHTDAAIHALQDAKIRAVYGYGPSFGFEPFWFDVPPGNGVNPYPEDIFRLRKQFFASSDQLLTLALAAAGPEFSNVAAAQREWNVARHPDAHARITTHVGVGKGGQHGLLGQLHAALVASGKPGLGPDTTYIHCCTLSDAELDLIANTGGTVSLAVPIEMQMGHGTPPIQQFLDRGVRPSLSVDVETNQPSDMFTQMHACFALQRALFIDKHANDCLFEFFVDPEPCRPGVLNVRDVLEFVTIEGARASDLLHKTGTLKPGKQADIILLRTKQIDVAPINDVIGAVVLGMDASNVDSVFIGGNAVKRNGRLVGVDTGRVLRDAANAREKLLSR